MHNAYQLDLVTRWLERLRYKPGSAMRARMDGAGGMETITVDFSVRVFDSTRASATRVVRNRSVRVAMQGASLGELHSLQSTDVIDQQYYDVGPDLVGGPLIEVATSRSLPPFLVIPEGPDEPVRPVYEQDFQVWLRQVLHELEAHEADEWLQSRDTGRPLFDPHTAG